MEDEECEARVTAAIKRNPEIIVKEGTQIRHLEPIELMTLGQYGRPKPVLGAVWPELLGVIFGAGTGAFINFGTRRPIFSGIHKYFISTAVWVSGLQWFWNKRTKYLIERDAVLRHYIMIHPDVWPPLTTKNIKALPKKKKYGDADYLEKWSPVR